MILKCSFFYTSGTVVSTVSSEEDDLNLLPRTFCVEFVCSSCATKDIYDGSIGSECE